MLAKVKNSQPVATLFNHLNESSSIYLRSNGGSFHDFIRALLNFDRDGADKGKVWRSRYENESRC